jgi:hypothetical protein
MLFRETTDVCSDTHKKQKLCFAALRIIFMCVSLVIHEEKSGLFIIGNSREFVNSL